MSKTKTTKELESGIYEATHKMGTFGAFEVTIGWYGSERVDYMTYDTKGIFRCYEIKQSLNDFNSKAAISFVGNYNYYVLTAELYEKVKDKIPEGIGAYVHNGYNVECCKRPKKRELSIDRELLLGNMVRSLEREADKIYQGKNEAKQALIIKRLNHDLTNYENETKKLKTKYNILMLFMYKRFPHDFGEDYYNFIEEMNKKKASEIKAEVDKYLIGSWDKYSTVKSEGDFTSEIRKRFRKDNIPNFLF